VLPAFRLVNITNEDLAGVFRDISTILEQLAVRRIRELDGVLKFVLRLFARNHLDIRLFVVVGIVISFVVFSKPPLSQYNRFCGSLWRILRRCG
jgi:hypothetical protein